MTAPPDTKTVGVVLLAAGGSSRLGQPKQLLKHQGQTLVRRAAEAALGVGLGPVVGVLGAHHEAIALELTGLPLHCVHHADWALGPGGSLKAGLSAVLATESSGGPTVDAVLVMLCDQLRVDASHLKALVTTWRTTGAAVVASAYDGTQGVPALFSRSVFAELDALSPAQGARGVIARDTSRVETVALPGGHLDVDTPEDLVYLM